MSLQPVSQGVAASPPVVGARVLRLAQRASMRGVSHETPEPSTPPENPSETLGNPWKASGKRVLPGVLHAPLGWPHELLRFGDRRDTFGEKAQHLPRKAATLRAGVMANFALSLSAFSEKTARCNTLGRIRNGSPAP
jgi:hypothetical protein